MSTVPPRDAAPRSGSDRGADVLPGLPLPQRPLPAGPVLPEGGPVAAAAVPVAPERAAGPAHDQPASEQPVAAEQPTAPRRGRHAAPEPEPSEDARRRVVLLGALGLVVVLVAVALFGWPGLLTGSSGDPAPGAAPSSPAASAPSVQLGVPDEIAGLPRITGAADEKLRAAVAAGQVDGLTDPISGVYGATGGPSLQVIAWNAVDPPEAESIAAAFAGFTKSSGAEVSAIEEIPVGGLAGTMACGSTTVGSSPAVLCFWADAGSFGSVTVLDPDDVAAAQATAAAARLEVESAP